MAFPRLARSLTRRVDVPCINPGFPFTLEDVEQEIARMRAAPVGVQRPVVVLAGYRAWSIMPRNVAAKLAMLTGAPLSQFLPVAYPWSFDIPALGRRVVELVETRWPSGDPEWTVPVDAVGISMGGLVARSAAAGLGGGGKRLNIQRLFTLGTPHRGAKLARLAAPDRAARDMRPGSALLGRLDEDLEHARYELICYARLRDVLVGARNTAPAGRHPHWVSGWRVCSHVAITMDWRILIDIARRLRGEQPLAATPVCPPRD